LAPNTPGQSTCCSDPAYLDCTVDPNRKIDGGNQALLDGLFPQLAVAVQEMSAIDRFNQTYWTEAVRHLAVRRAIWVGGENSPGAAFADRSKPTFDDFLRGLSADTEGLLALIDVTQRNRVSPGKLHQAMKESGIDLAAQIAFAERLVALSAKRASVGAEQLSAARSVLLSDPAD
jgi:hypothetical protein